MKKIEYYKYIKVKLLIQFFMIGDRIVAINGQNLLNLCYEDALKMLQSSSETVELVLSQPATRKNMESKNDQDQGDMEKRYLQ